MRSAAVLAAVPVLLLADASAGRAQPPIPVVYPLTELGQVQTNCFYACFGPGCNAPGAVDEIDVGPPFHVRGVRLAHAGGGANPCLPANSVSSIDLTLPRTVPAGQALVFDVDVVPVDDGHFKRPLRLNGATHFELAVDVLPVGDCDPGSQTHCLSGDRFQVRTFWRAFNGARDPGRVVPGASADSGLFYFFDSSNWEQLVKVLDGCGTNDRFWVFAASTTNVEYTQTVVDTESGAVKIYFNPAGQPAPAVTDTSAFATCP
jgi:hypothetical protein